MQQGAASFFTTFGKIRYNLPTTILPVIINVAGGGTITYNLDPIGNDALANTQVIRNHAEAARVDFRTMVNGSVLALQAAISNATRSKARWRRAASPGIDEVHLGT